MRFLNRVVYVSLVLSVVVQVSCSKATKQPDALMLNVKKDCSGIERCFHSIQTAVDTVAEASPGLWSHIHVEQGNYFEKVVVSSSKVKIVGEGRSSTKLYFDAVAETSAKYHRDGWGTAGSATLTINASDVIVKNITIENSFDYLANDALPLGAPNKVRHSQGVAVLLDENSDRIRFENTALLGNQDTLFANGYRALIRDSVIAGNVDFIFGNGFVVIEDSEIRSRARGIEMSTDKVHSYIAAPSTQINQSYGLVIIRSHLTRDSAVPDASVTLARPWHPTTTFEDGRYADPNAIGYAAFIDCFMDAHIHSSRWSSMRGTARDGTKSAIFHPEDSRFYEVGSSGPGALQSDVEKTSSVKIEEVIYNALFQDWNEPLQVPSYNELN